MGLAVLRRRVLRDRASHAGRRRPRRTMICDFLTAGRFRGPAEAQGGHMVTRAGKRRDIPSTPVQ
jgi:hypothetical protein